MTRRCSILPVFISGGLGALWNIRPKGLHRVLSICMQHEQACTAGDEAVRSRAMTSNPSHSRNDLKQDTW